MYDYNRSLRDNFRSSINRVSNNPLEETNSSPSLQQTTEGVTRMPNITPDYNVSIPIGYTKLGVEKLRNGQEIHCYKLNNGQKVYIAPKESAMTVLNTYVNTGSMNEKDSERGISHFCEHMAFNGTKGTDNYEKIESGETFKRVDELGGYCNASTGHAETNYTISIPQFKEEDFEKIVKMQASMMNNLEMSDEMVEKEHGPVTSEINMYADRPLTVAQNTAIKNLYNINSSSDDIIAGTVDNILNIDKQKVNDYYKNNYYPANMTTVVTGDVNPDEAINIIAKHFRGQNPQNPDRRTETLRPIQQTIRKDIMSDKAVGTTGVLCFNGPSYNNIKDNVAVNALIHFMFNRQNSKINNQLRDYNAVVAGTNEKISNNVNDGRLLSIVYDSTEENSEIALKNIFHNLATFQAPSPKELENLKTELKIMNEKCLEDMNSLNQELGNSGVMGNIDSVVKEMDVLDSLTPQDLVEVAHKYFDTNKASIAVVHPDTTNLQDITNNYTKAQTISFTGLNNVQNNKKIKQPINISEVSQYKLNNNIDIALIKSKNELANYSLNIKNPIPPQTKAGVVSMLSEMLSTKTYNYSNFIEDNQINLNLDSSLDGITFDVEVPAKNINASMDLMKELLLNPDFSEENFNRAKQTIKDTISTTTPTAEDNSLKELFPDSPRGYTNKDVLENIDKIELADVVGLYKYITSNCSAVCSANLPIEKYPEAKNVFDYQMSTMPQFRDVNKTVFNDFKPIARSKVVRDVASTAQADIIETFKFKDDHTPRTRVINQLLTGILCNGNDTGLFNNLREKEKLAYDVHAFYSPSKYSSSTISCRILTTTDASDYKAYENVQRSIDGFNNQISKMVNGEFTDEEFNTVKLKLKRSLLEMNDLQEDKVINLSGAMMGSLVGINEYNERFNLIDTITRDDIIKASKEIFSQKPIYSIRASKDTLDTNREYLDRLEG